ncbi:MAG: phage terminase large subunit family protein [Treponema sp.]|nr:phage terminase large subunit family protein [Treponema sp.]
MRLPELSVSFLFEASRLHNQGYPFTCADEVDAYPDKIKKERDMISLVRSRTNAFSRNRKTLWISTPLVEQSSHRLPS